MMAATMTTIRPAGFKMKWRLERQLNLFPGDGRADTVLLDLWAEPYPEETTTAGARSSLSDGSQP